MLIFRILKEALGIILVLKKTVLPLLRYTF